VVFEPGAFDAVVDGQYFRPALASAVQAARAAINGWILLEVPFIIGIRLQPLRVGFGLVPLLPVLGIMFLLGREVWDA
jgi:hypothetical protein